MISFIGTTRAVRSEALSRHPNLLGKQCPARQRAHDEVADTLREAIAGEQERWPDVLVVELAVVCVLPAPRESEIQRLLETIRSRVERLLRKWGLDEAGDTDADDSGIGERLARSVNRPPIASERLSLGDDGTVIYRLRTPFHDGTSALVFKPLQFIARLAALVPPPRFHLLTYHGVLAPNHALRSRVVPRKAGYRHKRPIRSDKKPRSGRHPWADLMRRVYSFDVLRCDGCGSRKVIVATITQREVIEKILAALNLPTEPPFIHPARSHPLLF